MSRLVFYRRSMINSFKNHGKLFKWYIMLIESLENITMVHNQVA